MSVTGEAGRSSDQDWRAGHRPRRGDVRARGNPRGPSLPRREPAIGQHIDTSLLEAGHRVLGLGVGRVLSPRGYRRRRSGSAHRMLAPYQAIRCADGYITLGAGTDRLFQRLCEVLGHPEWTADPDFANDTLRVRNRAPLIERIEADHDRGTLRSLARAVRRRGRALRPHQQLRGRLRRSAGPRAGNDRRCRPPDARAAANARLADQDVRDAARVGRRAPLLGEHTQRSCAKPAATRARSPRSWRRIGRPRRLEPGVEDHESTLRSPACSVSLTSSVFVIESTAHDPELRFLSGCLVRRGKSVTHRSRPVWKKA